MPEEVASIIEAEVQRLAVADELYGHWRNNGLPDSANLIHSHGISYLCALGQAKGFTPLLEAPSPDEGPYGHAGEHVRSDAVWLSRSSLRPAMLSEFERYAGAEDEGKLQAKMLNLLLACHRWNAEATPVLAYWTKGARTLPQHEHLSTMFRHGCVTQAGERIPGRAETPLFLQFVLRETRHHWRLWQIKRRGSQA